MDAVEFVKERNRMCKMYYKAGDDVCSDCPAKYEKCTMIDPMGIMTEGEIAKIVQIVEKWSIEHPRKTRQSEFLKQWPNVKLGVDGLVPILPCGLDTEYPRKNGCLAEDGYCTRASRGCAKCSHDFWMQEVE